MAATLGILKLRFKGNTLRLRLNQLEVRELASGAVVRERVPFPSGALEYQIKRSESGFGTTFKESLIDVSVPADKLTAWAASEEIGIYFEVQAGAEKLRVSIEKDLECIDGPADEIDPNAYPRAKGQLSC
jgi:hypothetical protein